MLIPAVRTPLVRSFSAVLLGTTCALAGSSASSTSQEGGAESTGAQEPATAAATPAAEAVAEAPALVISAKRVIVRPGKVLENAMVVIENGEIVDVGTDVELPSGATRIEGEVVCAAFMDPWSIAAIDPGSARDDGTGAATRAVDAIDPYSNEHALQQTVQSGVLLARTQVGARADYSGVGAVVRTSGAEVLLPDASVSSAVGVARGNGFDPRQFRGLGYGGLGYGGISFSAPTVDPIDRIGQIDKLANELASGKKYGEDVAEYEVELAAWETTIAEKEKELEDDFKKAKKARDKKVEDAKEKGEEVKDKKYKEDRRPRAPKLDAEKATFARVVNGEVPLVVYAERALEIRELLRVTEPFDRLRLVIAGGTSAMAVADHLAERGVPVIVSPSPASAGGPVGQLDPGLALAAELDAAGVEVLIGSGATSAMASRDLPLLAALAVGHGLDRDAALRAITLGPARVFDVAHRVGTVARGRSADLLVLTADPLSSTARVIAAISGGKVVHRSNP